MNTFLFKDKNRHTSKPGIDHENNKSNREKVLDQLLSRLMDSVNAYKPASVDQLEKLLNNLNISGDQLENLRTNFSMALNSITVKDVINEARSVPVFKGDGTYELSHFIKEVETLIGMVTDDAAKQYIFRILTTKIQGNAAESVRRITNQNPSWEIIKTQLIKSFGVQETYLKLKEKADSIRFINVSQYYEELIKILDKLNLKYSLDTEKPIDFKPENNEHSILEKFLNKLPRPDSMYLRMKQVNSLEQAYHELLQTGIDSNRETRTRTQVTRNRFPNQQNNRHFHNNYSNNNNRNTDRTHNNFYPNYNRQYDQYQPRNFEDFNGGNRFRNSGNYRRNNPSGQYSHNRQHTANHNPSGQYSHNRHHIANHQPEPMEIDHTELHENFHIQPRDTHYL